MIEGITVLAQETIAPSTGGIILAFIGAGIFLITGILLLILSIIDDTSLIALSALALIGACVIGAIGFSELSQEPYVKYKVLIDQDVSWSEVYENYEIIDQEGQIYTIKEK